MNDPVPWGLDECSALLMADTPINSRINTSRPVAPSTWRASRHYIPLPPPPIDPEIDAPPKMGPDGRIIKKVRPRRTVDLYAGVGRWEMVSSLSEHVLGASLTRWL